ncbi:hypothetical protein RIF29_25956 [Crotalaria pallida]|uniref:Uncharacterized protein n=1 Tax=Crotalaria pallida TaxID=3830 RepID=A0AAN9HZL2_CROPI
MIKEAHEEVEDSSTRHVEELENMEQRLMDELDLVFKETHQQEEDNGLIPLNSSLGILDQKRSNAGSQGHDLRQQKEIELVESVCTTSQEREFEKESRCGQKVDANVDVNIFVNNDGLPHSGTSEDKHEIQNLMSSFDISFDNGDIEDGEIFGDFMLDGDLFDLSSVDPMILQLDDIDD